MFDQPLQLEGTWEEIVARLPHVAGQRLKVLVYSAADLSTAPKEQRPLAKILAEIAAGIPQEELAKLPPDLSDQLDHYIYGAPEAMKQVFADTLYWVAIITPNDPWHDSALNAAAALGPAQIVTTEEVLSEFLSAYAARGPYLRQ